MKRSVEQLDVERLEHLLSRREAGELRVRKYGSSLIVEVGPKTDAVKCLRFERDTVHLWRLSIADHRGRWEKTPYRATLSELLDLVFDQFSWVMSR